MGKKILDSKILYVVLSILISLSLWLWVTSRDDNKEPGTFRIPVNFTGVEMLEDRGLMIVNPNVTATVTVRATPMILAILNDTPLKVTASVANITSEGTQQVNYTVEPPPASNSDVEYIYSGNGGTAVNVEVARFLRREGVEIRGEFKGSAAEGYLPGDKDDFLFSPGTLTISGRAELVNQVAYAKVTITEEDLRETVSDEFPFQLIGASGNPLELDVTCDVDMIYTIFPIRATAEIPLEVKVVDGGGLKESDVRVKLSESSIMVAGSQEAVDALVNQGAITLTTIDLATLDDDAAENGSERTFSIPLTDELENLSGITEVTVNLRVLKRVETRTFQVSDSISFINTPEGWTPTIITQVLPVKVRGTEALLNELSEENIRVVADLRDINEAAGPHTVSASVYLDSAGTVTDVGVVNPGSYTIVVSLAGDG